MVVAVFLKSTKQQQNYSRSPAVTVQPAFRAAAAVTVTETFFLILSLLSKCPHQFAVFQNNLQ